MKFFIQIIAILSMVFLVTSSISAEAPKEIELSNGEVVKVSFFAGSNGYRYEVKFENGHKYTYELTGDTAFGSGSMELTDEEMDLAQEAIDKYQQMYGYGTVSNDNNSSGSPIGILFILAGLLGAIFPYAAWYLEIGWKLRDAEPSELALISNRLGGILVAVVGFFILI